MIVSSDLNHQSIPARNFGAFASEGKSSSSRSMRKVPTLAMIKTATSTITRIGLGLSLVVSSSKSQSSSSVISPYFLSSIIVLLFFMKAPGYNKLVEHEWYVSITYIFKIDHVIHRIIEYRHNVENNHQEAWDRCKKEKERCHFLEIKMRVDHQ